MQEQLSIRIDSELRAWLVRRAAAEVRTVGALVRAILTGVMWADSVQAIPERPAEAESELAESEPWDDLDIPEPLRRTPQP